MTDVDKAITDLGYKMTNINLKCNFIVYENIKDDTEVTIEWDEDDDLCCIFAYSISSYLDFYGQPYQDFRGLSIKEYSAFCQKIKEMKKNEGI